MCARFAFILTIGVAALLAWSPVAAQDEGLSDEELALVEYVEAAFDNLNAQGSYRIYSEQTATGFTDSNQFSYEEDLNIVVDVQVMVGEEDELTTLLGQVSVEGMTDYGQGAFLIDDTVETILIDDIFYMRFTVQGDDPLGERSVYGDTWQFLTMQDIESLAGDFLFLQNMDAQALLLTTDTDTKLFLLPIAEENVNSISELPGEMLDGKPMRVFLTDINYLEYMAQDFEFLIAQIAEDDGSELDAILERAADGIVVQQKFWIGDDDDLPHQVELNFSSTISEEIFTEIIEFVPEAEGLTMSHQNTSQATTTLGEFGVPFEVEAPENAERFRYFSEF